MNVYIVELSRRLADLGIEVEIFTRATTGALPPAVDLAPGVLVRHVTAGPYEGLSKEDLPGQLCAFTSGVLRTEAMHEPGYYDLIHSHYWLSGQVGWLAKERWGVPLVHSMHTMARVKTANLAAGDDPEPPARAIGEAQVVEAADRLIASTDDEAEQLVSLYDADPARVVTIAPGVDLEQFHPGSHAAARQALGIAADAVVLVFAGRLQPLKGPDLLLHAAAQLAGDTALRDRLVVLIVGGRSGSGLVPEHLQKLAGDLGIADLVRFQQPVAHEELADYYRSATAVVVPSHSESFGLVALEAQACGVPVIAADVGGLRTAVARDRSGLLITGHDPADYAAAARRLIDDPDLRRRLTEGAVTHASRFGWAVTAARVLEVYHEAL